MRLFALAFLAGTVLLQQAAELPACRGTGLAAALLLAAQLGGRWVRGPLLLAAGLAAGYDLAAWRAEERLADALPPAWEGHDIEVEGVVSGLPQPGERGTRFLFDADRVHTPGAVVPSRVSLTWYAGRGKGGEAAIPPPEIRAGERWRMTVRLKRPRGLANPHAFDFEPWALARGIRATGYVRVSPEPGRIAAREGGWPQDVHRLRQGVRDAMQASLGEARFAGVLVALAIGDQDAIAQPDWQVFWRTGVGHLVSISGLHVTMLASLAFLCVTFAWSRFTPLVRWLPSRKAGVAAGVLAALAYTLAAGYGVPAQRTLVMLAVAAVAVLADRAASPSRVLAGALLAVLVVDPWAALAPGFWLSFGAVAAIFHALSLRTGTLSSLKGAILTQSVVTLALWPALALLFGEVSLVAPLANAFAIPVVSLLIVPLTLAGALTPWDGPLAPAHALMAATMVPLEWLAAVPGAVAEYPALPWASAGLAVAGTALLLAPRGLPLRGAGVVLLLPMALHRAPAPLPGEAWVDVLDVGQGLAVVVRTARHALACDAGPAWGGETDGGSRIVVPFLRGEGVRRLDGMVVTHADTDHAGGAASVARSREPRWLVSALPPDDGLHGAMPDSWPCVAGLQWFWDGVSFEILHPSSHALRDGRRRINDRSCVLRVEAAGGAMILAADIERAAEAELVARARDRLRADALLVPHHGSRTSSTPAFVDAVSPKVALVSAGWRNRFRQPAAVVEARYRERGTEIRRTDVEGALRVTLPASAGEPVAVRRLVDRPRYWSDRIP